VRKTDLQNWSFTIGTITEGKVRKIMGSKVEYVFSAQNLLMSLLLLNKVLVNSVFSETVHQACPSECICDTSHNFTILSVTCSYLELTEIPTISSPYSVQLLDLSNNQLTHIREFIFKDYRVLETLVLCGNEIDVVDSRAFSGIGMLIDIDLSYNKIRFIPLSIFSDNPVLERVSFRGNPLGYVPDSSPIFASPSVISLDLSFCSLTSINSQTFSQLPGLQVLDLYSNNLREIRKDMFNPLTELVVIDLGNNFWKCDCGIVEVLSCFSERRQSRLLDEEHKPVKCFDAGVYKTMWSAANKDKVCAEQSPVISSTTIPTESSNILELKENKEETPTAGSWWGELLSWNTNTVLVFIILPLMLGIATFVSLITVYFVINVMNSRRQSTVSSVSKNGTENSKRHLFSRIPSTPSSISSDSIAEKQIAASGSSSVGDRPNAYDSYHLYERIE
jgi:hypothetical protein